MSYINFETPCRWIHNECIQGDSRFLNNVNTLYLPGCKFQFVVNYVNRVYQTGC